MLSRPHEVSKFFMHNTHWHFYVRVAVVASTSFFDLSFVSIGDLCLLVALRLPSVHVLTAVVFQTSSKFSFDAMLQRPRSFYLIGLPVESVSIVADVFYDVLSQMHDTRLEGFQVSQTASPLPCIDKWMSESVTHQRLIGLGCTVLNFGVCRRHGHGHNCVNLLLLLLSLIHI